MISEQDIYALKTICGAINYVQKRYKKPELSEADYNYIIYPLRLEAKTIYGIELTIMGFIFYTKRLTLTYTDNMFHDKRIIDIKENQY